MTGPLEGVRVQALEQILAGPYGSMVLGDLGAEVRSGLLGYSPGKIKVLVAE